MDRSRYDSAMFWLPFGTAAAVIGLALMTIGVTRLPSSQSVWSSVWFDAGLGVLALGALLLLWSLLLYARHRRGEARATTVGPPASTSSGQAAPDKTMAEAVRGYFREREKMIDIWDRQKREEARRKKKG